MARVRGCIVKAPQTDASPMVAPIDRSMPPINKTRVSPVDGNQDDRKLPHDVLEISDRHESVDRERKHDGNDDDDRKHRNVANDIQKQPKARRALARAGLERLLSDEARTPVIELVFGPRRFRHFAQPQTLSLVVEKLAFVYSRPGRSWTRSLSAIFL